MSIRTLWTIIIKIVGMSLMISLFKFIPQIISMIQYNSSENKGNIIILSIFILLILLIYILIFWLLIFKSARIIDVFHLDKGFNQDKIDLNIKSSTIISVASIVIGAIIFINSLPQLCQQIFQLFQDKTIFRESPNSAYIIFHTIKTLLGYLLMTNSKYIVKFVDKKQKAIDL